MTIYNFYTIRELAPQQHECFPDMNFGYNTGHVKNRIYLPDTFVGATYYFDGEFSNRYGTSQLDEQGHPYIDINFNNGEIGNGTVFIIAGKRYCTFPYTLEYVNVFETEIDASEIDTSNLVTKQTFDNTVERIDNDITTGDTANRTAIDQLTAATSQRFADVNTTLSGYDEQIGAVDTEVKNLASEVDGYSTDIAKAVADAADAKSVAEGAADDAATADAAAKEAHDSVAALDTRVGAVENSVETAETTANEAKSAAQTAQTTAGEAQTAASGAKSRADEAYTLAETAQSDAEGATTKATTAQSTADGVKTRVDTIEETTIPGISSRVEALQAGEETLSKSIELLSSSVETVEENYNTLSDSVGLLTTQVQQNTSGLAQHDTNISELQSKYTNIVNNYPVLKSKVIYNGEVGLGVNLGDLLVEDGIYPGAVVELLVNFYAASAEFVANYRYKPVISGNIYPPPPLPDQPVSFTPSASFDSGSSYYLIANHASRFVGMYESVLTTGEFKLTDAFTVNQKLMSYFQPTYECAYHPAMLTVNSGGSPDPVSVSARIIVLYMSNKELQS